MLGHAIENVSFFTSAARRSLQPQHVLHGVNAGTFPDDPLRGAQRPVGKGVTAAGLVGQLHALAVVGENDGVIPDHIATAQGMDADLSAGALAGDALPPVPERLLQLPYF